MTVVRYLFLLTTAGPAQEEVGHPLEACVMATAGIDPLDTQPLANLKVLRYTALAFSLVQVIPASSFEFPRFKQLKFQEQEGVCFA